MSRRRRKKQYSWFSFRFGMTSAGGQSPAVMPPGALLYDGATILFDGTPILYN